jgi:hypothetical protein
MAELISELMGQCCSQMETYTLAALHEDAGARFFRRAHRRASGGGRVEEA